MTSPMYVEKFTLWKPRPIEELEPNINKTYLHTYTRDVTIVIFPAW